MVPTRSLLGDLRRRGRVKQGEPAMITGLTRRYALTGGAALAAAPLLGWPRLAIAAGVALAPDYTVNWRVHKMSTKVKVEQISGGIRASTSTLLDDIK